MTHQELRNALSQIEDAARAMRNQHRLNDKWDVSEVCHLVTQLAQLVREEIAK